VGGHSSIQQFGDDPQPSYQEQCALVAAGLTSGITLVDTTYHQERHALERAPRELDRRMN